jgi:hypothetical protein
VPFCTSVNPCSPSGVGLGTPPLPLLLPRCQESESDGLARRAVNRCHYRRAAPDRRSADHAALAPGCGATGPASWIGCLVQCPSPNIEFEVSGLHGDVLVRQLCGRDGGGG